MYKDLWEMLPEVVKGLCRQRDLLVKQPAEGLGVRFVAAKRRLALCSTLVLQAQQPDIWDLIVFILNFLTLSAVVDTTNITKRCHHPLLSGIQKL